MESTRDKKTMVYVINEDFKIVYICDELKSVVQENSWKNKDIVNEYAGYYQKYAENSGGVTGVMRLFTIKKVNVRNVR